jgi:hypothetical protein
VLGASELGRSLVLLGARVAVEALLPLVGAADDLGDAPIRSQRAVGAGWPRWNTGADARRRMTS